MLLHRQLLFLPHAAQPHFLSPFYGVSLPICLRNASKNVSEVALTHLLHLLEFIEASLVLVTGGLHDDLFLFFADEFVLGPVGLLALLPAIEGLFAP